LDSFISTESTACASVTVKVMPRLFTVCPMLADGAVVARMVGCGGVTTPGEDLSSAVIVPVVHDVGE
jgi:hypothetical protein